MSLEQEMINLYIQAEKDVLEGKTVTLNGRTLSSENLIDIRKGRREWEQRIKSRSGGRSHSLGRINF